MTAAVRCPVCHSRECHPHGWTGPLPRCLGGDGIDAVTPETVPVGRKRRMRRPVETTARHPGEDRSPC